MKPKAYQYFPALTMVLVIFTQNGFCQDGKKPAAKKETVKPAATKTDWSIPWLEGTSFDTATIVIKRFGRLQRNDKWDPPPGYSIGGIDYLSKQVLALKEAEFTSPVTRNDIRGMKAYALFYKARSLGNKANSKDPTEEDLSNIMADLKTAVQLGYSNHREILGAEKELHHVFDIPEFKDMIDQLEKDYEKRIRVSFPKKVADGFAFFGKAEKKSWKPELKTGTGDNFWPEGAPSIVVLSRIHHDGYNKYIKRLEKIAAAKGLKPALRTAFYQYNPEDKTRLEQTARYVKSLGTSSPYAVIGRSQYKALRETLKARYEDGAEKAGRKNVLFDIFQPVVIFFDADGVPLYQTNGVLDRDWKIETVLDGFTAATGTGPAKEEAAPPTETPAEGKKE